METENKHQPNYYAVIPADVRYSDAPPAAKLLYGEITALCNKEGFCWATNKYFADLYQVDAYTITRWVGSLVKLGFIKIEVDQAAGNSRKMWLINPSPLHKIVGTSPQKSGEGYPQKSPNEAVTPILNNTSINTPQNGVSDVGKTPFEEFWKLYPRKVEKKKAQSKWNHLKKSDQEAILADLPKRAKCDQWQRGFIPYPMTYLNGERWNDEIVQPAQAGHSTTGKNWTQERIEDEREREREREQAKQNRMMDNRAAIDSPARQKFNALKEKFKIGH